MSGYRRSSSPEIRCFNRKEREKENEGHVTHTRIIHDGEKSIHKARKAYERNAIEEGRDIIIALYKEGIPIAQIMKETCLNFSSVNSIIAKYEFSRQPENIARELTKALRHQKRPLKNGCYPKHPFNYIAIFEELRDILGDKSWTKNQVEAYIRTNAQGLIELRSFYIRAELEKRDNLTDKDLEEIAQIIGTHIEIVEVEYRQVGGRGDTKRLSSLASKYGLTPEQMSMLDDCFNDPENKIKTGVNYIGIGKTLEDKFGKIPELDLKNITEIYRAEYQEKQ